MNSGYFARNFANWLNAQRIIHGARLAAKAGGFMTMHGELEAVYMPGNWRRPVRRLGVISARVVTDAGAALLVDDFDNGGGARVANVNQHDAGTGNTAEAAGDTALVTPWGGARVAGTRSQPAANQFRSVATITFTGTFAIVEHGIFSAASGATLWDRSVFAAINVVNTDAIQFTYTLTVNSGG